MTLIELLLVIVMVGILAGIAAQFFRGQVDSSRMGETVHMVGLIKMAQEGYRADSGHYLDVSSDINTSCYPHGDMSKLGTTIYDWKQSTGQDAWNRLGVDATGAMHFCYATVAGDRNDAPPAISLTGGASLTFPAADGPWYIVRAIGDPDADNRYTIVVGSSFSNRIALVQDDGYAL